MTGPAIWRHDEAGPATGGDSNAAWQATGLSIDSRSLVAGDLFIALRGPRFDGHDHVAAAFAAGAAAAVVSRPPAGLPPGAPLLRVADTGAALRDLARHARARMRGTVIAITGSVGKTGTRMALCRLLAARGPTHGTTGNLNNEIGLPLSLARMPADTAWGVFELGMNHAGEIDRLSRLVRPDIGLITTVTAAHLAFFADVAGIADAKAELFNGMASPATAILNRDDTCFSRLSTAARAAGLTRTIGFGAHPGADMRLTGCDRSGDGSRVRAVFAGQPLAFDLPLPGRHWVMNALAILATLAAAGHDPAAVAGDLAGLELPAGRGGEESHPLRGGRVHLIDDSYNASPAAMRAALDVLAHKKPAGAGRRLAVLGDMLELGPAAAAMHRDLARDIVAAEVALAFLAGPHMKELFDALPAARRGAHGDSAAALWPAVAAALRPDDIVLVKGSLGSRMGSIAEAMRNLARHDRPCHDRGGHDRDGHGRDGHDRGSENRDNHNRPCHNRNGNAAGRPSHAV